MRLLIITILTLLSAAVSAAAPSIKIHGKVTDADNKPVEFATVRIGGTAIGTTTGLEGDYSFSCPAADTITVHFSCIGYRDAKSTLIDAGPAVTLNMRLQMDTEMLAEVEVVELKKQTGSIAVIDKEQLKL